MSIACPYCRHSAKLKALGPGKYAPRCPKCGRKFVLTVPKDPEAQPVVEPLAEAAPDPGAPTKATTSPTVKATAPPPAPVGVADLGATNAFEPPAESAATGEFRPDQSLPAAVGSPTTDQSKDLTRRSITKSPGRKAALALPSTLDGYQILEELGQGGMGAVMLARQVSLDRQVALKVMNERCAGDPVFLGRFTREAYAAAQLVHHNIVQIYDIGEDKGIHFFSMEYVKGQNLQAIVHDHGRLDPEVAVGYALQAARGLKFAHDLGMIHRDIKPENIMVNDQGIVKVADLGLVKLALDSEKDLATKSLPGTASAVSRMGSGDISVAGAVIGTPAYMSPEQGRGEDVDPRTDMYSLGCTLYVLLTGRQPFTGKTIKQLLTQHATAAIVPPETVAPHVPRSLSALLLRMMAKKPADRFRDMGEVAEKLEEYLGIQTTGPFTPREEQALALEGFVQRFNNAPMAKVRWPVMAGFAALCPILILIALLAKQFLLAGGFLGLGILTPLCAFVVHGAFHGSPIFSKAREWVFASSWRDWLLWSGGAVFLLLILYLTGLLWIWLGFCVVAVLLGFGYYFGIERPLLRQREGALVEAEKLFRDLRLRGVDEETLRHFVAKYSGKNWEEFYEALFGYEAKQAARVGLKGEAGRARARSGVWREPLVEWLELQVQSRRAVRERRHLQAVEERSLRAEGVDPKEAQRRAARMAEVFVGEAGDMRRPGAIADRAGRMRRLLTAARNHDTRYVERPPSQIVAGLGRMADQLLGGKIRFLVGSLLLVGCLMWFKQNEIVPSEDVRESFSGVFAGKGLDVGKLQKQTQEGETRIAKPLVVPGLPEKLTEVVDGFNAGGAGLVLLFTCIFWGWRAGLVIWLGALVILRGSHWGIPTAGPLSAALVSLAVGTAVAFIGGFFLRRG